MSDNVYQNWLDRAEVNNYIAGKRGGRELWKEAYREARRRSKTFIYECDDLFKFRGFGPLKNVIVQGNNIGRARVYDLREFLNNVIAAKVGLTDHNPNRILDETKIHLKTVRAGIQTTEIMTYMSQPQDTHKRTTKISTIAPTQFPVTKITRPIRVEIPDKKKEEPTDYRHLFVTVVQRF